MPTPLFQPLPGQSPLTESELNALTLVMSLSSLEITRAVSEIAADGKMPFQYRALAIWTWSCITLERVMLEEEIEALTLLTRGYTYSRVCPECDTTLEAGNYCVVCRAVVTRV